MSEAAVAALGVRSSKKLQHAKPALKLQVSAANRTKSTGPKQSSRSSSRGAAPSQRSRESSMMAPRQQSGSPPRQKGKKPAGFSRLVPPSLNERELRPDPSRTDPSLTTDRDVPISPLRRSPTSERRKSVKPAPLGVPQLLPPAPPTRLLEEPAETTTTVDDSTRLLGRIAGDVAVGATEAPSAEASPAEVSPEATSAEAEAEATTKAAAKKAADEAAALKTKEREASIEAAAAAAAEAEDAVALRSSHELLELREQQLVKQKDMLALVAEIDRASKEAHLQTGVGALKRSLGETLVAQKRPPNDLLRSWDKNRDGEISKIEFKQAIRSQLQLKATNSQIDELFDSFDDDGGGTICIRELRPNLKALYELYYREKEKEERYRAQAAMHATLASDLSSALDATERSERVAEKLEALHKLDRCLAAQVGELAENKLAGGVTAQALATQWGADDTGHIGQACFVKQIYKMKNTGGLFISGVSSEVRATIKALWDSLVSGGDGSIAEEAAAVAAAKAKQRGSSDGGAGKGGGRAAAGLQRERSSRFSNVQTGEIDREAAITRIQGLLRGHSTREAFHESHDAHALDLAAAVERMIGAAKNHKVRADELAIEAKAARAEAKRLQVVHASDAAREEKKAAVASEVHAEEEARWAEEDKERKKTRSGAATKKLSVIS